MMGGALAVRCGAAPTLEELALKRKDKLIVHSPRPLDIEAPPEMLDTWITPHSRFFVRSHFYIPNVEMARWELSMEGLVEKPFKLKFEELRSEEHTSELQS